MKKIMIIMVTLLLSTLSFAQGDMLPRKILKVEFQNIQEEMQYVKAVEAVIWGIPAVNFDRMLQAMIRDAGGGENKIVYWSKPADWRNRTLTPNSDNLYMMPFYNTEKGPMVLEIPAADGGELVGSVMDCWHMPMEDVGPAGADAGEGGKYLLLPPGYSGEVPNQYIALRMNTYQGYALLRSLPRSHEAADIARAADYMKRVRLYPLAEADGKPDTHFVDATDIIYDATIPYDIRFFESLDRVIQRNPWIERDRSMIDVLKGIGIVQGKPFSPDGRTKLLLEKAVQTAHSWFAHTLETCSGFYPGTHWFNPATVAYSKSLKSGFSDADCYPVDNRGFIFHLAYFSPKRVGKSKNQLYVMTARDNEGKMLDGAKSYRLRIPADVPVRQFWSVTVYDRETHAFFREVPVTAISSLNKDIQTNADGTVDIWFGPKAPADKVSNWIPTCEDNGFEILFRFYGAEKAALQKNWKLPDLERVEH